MWVDPLRSEMSGLEFRYGVEMSMSSARKEVWWVMYVCNVIYSTQIKSQYIGLRKTGKEGRREGWKEGRVPWI